MVAWLLVLGGLLTLGYVLLGYPMLIAALAWLRPRPVRPDEQAPLPKVSLLISAYNEAKSLPRKIRSLWQLDYPPELMEVLVADDGSADGTGDLAGALAAEPEAQGRLRLLDRTPNMGKPAQLNRLASEATGDILVFTDARQPLDPQAVRNLARTLSDPTVGGATGAVEYRNETDQPVLIGAYWRYESRLRTWEGLVHSCCGAAGPLMAVRAELYQPVPPNVVLDDVLTPLRVVIRGYRFVYAADALAIETFAMNRRHEYDRRVRTLGGNTQLLRLDPRIALPWRNPIWWQFCSHKLGRLLVPWCLIAMLLGSLLGWSLSLVFAVLFWLQVAAYLYAVVGWLGAGKPWAPPGSSLAYSVVLLAAAALAGLWRDLRGRSSARWGVAERSRRDTLD